MATLELECPNCGELLELDAGFAGGVCRCSSCAMLMSVPADPPQGPPEPFVRPERPGSPPGTLPRKPAAPRASAGRAVAPVPVPVPVPVKPSKAARSAPQAAAPPAAPRRRPARLLTFGIFGLALLVAAVLCAVALSLALRAENPGVAPAQPAIDPMSDAAAVSDLAKARGGRYSPLSQGQSTRSHRVAQATRTGAGDGP